MCLENKNIWKYFIDKNEGEASNDGYSPSFILFTIKYS